MVSGPNPSAIVPTPRRFTIARSLPEESDSSSEDETPPRRPRDNDHRPSWFHPDNSDDDSNSPPE